jgi:pimeloyl-ACP methyl ester carboxylesterase
MTSGWDEQAVQHRQVAVGEVRLHYVEAGAGPLVVLLHGFPEFWYGWRHQLPALAAAGYRAVAPDLRGYNLSDKPPGVRAYEVERLAGDVAGLVRACGAERAALVGHDWGGVVAWQVAMRHPALVERLVVLNAPHPSAIGRMLSNPVQWLRSAYILFFQLPRLPEALIRANDFALLRRLFRTDPVRREAFSRQDIERYVEAFRRPGALTAALNYYRAALRRLPPAGEDALRPIEQPVLVVWGQRDRALGPELAAPDRRWVSHLRLERLPDASHWVQHDRPERVNALMLDHLAGLGA